MKRESFYIRPVHVIISKVYFKIYTCLMRNTKFSNKCLLHTLNPSVTTESDVRRNEN